MLTPKRLEKLFSPALERNLTAYTLAGAAGLTALCAVPAQGEIIYTRVKAVGTPNTSVSIDLNHDGIPDFSIRDFFYTSSFVPDVASIVGAGYSNNQVAVGPGASAHAFNLGQQIGPTVNFANSPIIIPLAFSIFTSVGNTDAGGEFLNQTNKFMGLEFIQNGKTHYGWARVDVRSANHQLSFEVVDFAYQDAPGVAIRAGQGIRQGSSGSLGALAFGSAGSQLPGDQATE